MTTITEDINLPGAPGIPERMTVLVGPVNEYGQFREVAIPSGNFTIMPPAAVDVPVGVGTWSLDLHPSSEAGLYGRVIATSRGWSKPRFFNVPTSGTYNLADVEVDELDPVSSSVYAQHLADTSAHGGGIILSRTKVVANITLTEAENVWQELASLAVPAPVVRPLRVIARAHINAITSGTISGMFAIAPSGVNDLSIRGADWCDAAGLAAAYPIGKLVRAEAILDAGENNATWKVGFKKSATATGQISATAIIPFEFFVVGA